MHRPPRLGRGTKRRVNRIRLRRNWPDTLTLGGLILFAVVFLALLGLNVAGAWRP